MSDLYHGYDMRDWWDDKEEDLKVSELLQKHVANYGHIPTEILINKVDSESIKTGMPSLPRPVSFVLPHSILLEIVDPLEVKDGQIYE